MELPPTATMTEAPLLLPCPAPGRAADDCPIHMPGTSMRKARQRRLSRRLAGDQSGRARRAGKRGALLNNHEERDHCIRRAAPDMEEQRLVKEHGGCVKLDTSSEGLARAALRRGPRGSGARAGANMQAHGEAIDTVRIMAPRCVGMFGPTPDLNLLVPWTPTTAVMRLLCQKSRRRQRRTPSAMFETRSLLGGEHSHPSSLSNQSSPTPVLTRVDCRHTREMSSPHVTGCSLIIRMPCTAAMAVSAAMH